MFATLKIEGKEFSVEISDPELQKILRKEKETGYERKVEEEYYFITSTSCATKAKGVDYQDTIDNALYNSANYYTSKEVAENVARAERLMRQIRRFSVEHRDRELIWDSQEYHPFFYIYFDHRTNEISTSFLNTCQGFSVIYFDTLEHCKEAIEKFRDELYWYFTEYKDTAKI